jgi:hypothetical protein
MARIRPLAGLRRGISLVEMLVVITVAAAMMGLTVTTIHRLLGAEHDVTRQMRYAASVARLAQVFRDDLHAAREIEAPVAEPGKPPALLVVFPDARRARYELDRHLATRVELDRENETHHDSFYFPPGSRLEFERARDERLVRLTIDMPAGNPAVKPNDTAAARVPTHRLTIEAALINGKQNRE